MTDARWNSVVRRKGILEREGLLFAAEPMKRAFWSTRNRRRFRIPDCIGILAAKIVSDEGLRAARRLSIVRAAWQAVVPRRFADLSDVQSLRAGRLLVRVDGKATEFVLSRQLGATLVAAMNERLGNLRIDRIDYRVGSAKG